MPAGAARLIGRNCLAFCMSGSGAGTDSMAARRLSANNGLVICLLYHKGKCKWVLHKGVVIAAHQPPVGWCRRRHNTSRGRWM